MKQLVILTLISYSIISNASEYHCKLSNRPPTDPKAIEFTFDTIKEENKFVDTGDGSSVGCIVFRTEPPLIGCGRFISEKISNIVTTEDGVSILALDMNENGLKTNLTCIKQK